MTLEYKVTTDEDEIAQAEEIIRAGLGPDAVLPRDRATVVCAVVDGVVAGAGYITSLVRVDSFAIAPEYRESGLSFAEGIRAVDGYLLGLMREQGVERSGYITFLPNPDYAQRFEQLGYVFRPWLVFEKILTTESNAPIESTKEPDNADGSHSDHRR